MTVLRKRFLDRRLLLAVTVALLTVVAYRGMAILRSEPLLALANNYDMIRVQACIKAYPVRHPQIPPQAGNADAPIDRYQFRHDVGASCFPTTEVLFARIARPLFKAESKRTADGSFSIRWIGWVKFITFFAFAAGFSIAWWRQAKPMAALANAAIAAIVLTDPANTLYLSGFYAEFAVLLFVYVSLAGTAFLLGRERPPGALAWLLLALAVAALVGTKVQHIGLGLILAGLTALPALFGAKISRRVLSALAVGGAVGLAAQAVVLRHPGTDIMRLANLTSTVLTSLLPLSADPYQTVENLGIPRRCGAYVGLNWYLPPVRENPANHPCREVADTSYARLLGLAFSEPRLFVRFVGRSIAYIRPWIPATYRGVPHLGVVEGQRRAPLPGGWFSWSRILDRLPLWLIYALVVAPSLLMAALLALRRTSNPALVVLLTSLALLPFPIIVAVIFGNGYEDSAKQMHLVFSLVLSFWILLALLAVRAVASRFLQGRPARTHAGEAP